MCGIFSLLNNYNYDVFSQSFVETQFNKGSNPHTKKAELKYVGHKILMGVHENEVPIENNQPIIYNDIVLICDGEIFNYKELYEYMSVSFPITSRSCEVIIYLYLKYGIEYTLQVIEGEYAFILLDNSVHTDNYNLFVARDPFGVKPLYILHPEKNNSIDVRKRIIGFSSEKKVLNDFFENLEIMEYKEKNNDKLKEKPKYYLKPFQPGTYSSYYLSSKVFSSWTVDKKYEKYNSGTFSSLMSITSPQYNKDKLSNDIREYLFESTRKRCDIIRKYQDTFACLLTDDFESRQLLMYIKNYCSLFCNTPTNIETYSFGIEGSDELKNAKEIASEFGTTHFEIKYNYDDFNRITQEILNELQKDLQEAIFTQNDASIYLIGKYIAENSNNKTIFVAYGLSELFGYQLMDIKEPLEFDKNTRELLNDIHNTKLLKINNSFYSLGLEITAPYLDRAFVQHYLSIPAQIRSTREINL